MNAGDYNILNAEPMGFDELRSAVGLGIVLSFMVGPVFFVLLETAATKGFRAGLVLDIGVVLGDIFFILLAYFSSYQLVENISNGPALYVFGGAILVVYGLTLIIKRDSRGKEPRFRTKRNDYLGLFMKGFLLNVINVGVLIFWLGMVIVVGPAMEGDAVRIASFFSVVIGTYLLVDIGKILLAKQLRSKLTQNRVIGMRRVLGVLLVISGVIMIFRGFLVDHTVVGTDWDIIQK